MSDKIAPEVADAAIEAFRASLGGKALAESSLEILKRAYCDGLLSLDPDRALISYRLRAPIERPKGAITEVSLREPTGGQLRDATKDKREDMDATLNLLVLITGQALAVVQDIGQRDLTVLGTCLDFFA